MTHKSYGTSGPSKRDFTMTPLNLEDPSNTRLLPPDPSSNARRTTYSTRQLTVYTLVAISLFLASIVLGVAVPLAVQPESNNEQILEEGADGSLLTSSQHEVTALSIEDRVRHLLRRVPLIDGHNDFAWNLRNFLNNDISQLNFSSDLTRVEPWLHHLDVCHTDLPRLRKGMVGAQFWSAYIQCDSQYKDGLLQTLEQIDVIKRFVARYPNDLAFVTSAGGVVEAHRNGKIGSLIGVESGHGMADSLAMLRIFYELGVRYMTLTHNCNTPWADNNMVDSPDQSPEHNGITEFGKSVIREMNRLGMLVDLSHVSKQVMEQVLDVSLSPVIFSHSSAFAICNHTRNVHDDVLRRVTENKGIVMVNFYNKFVTCSEEASMDDVIAHINYIKEVAGVDHVGIGADFDGVTLTPTGLEDVSKYTDLFAALLRSGLWTEEELEKLAGRNLLRVLRANEQIRDKLKEEGQLAAENWIPEADVYGHTDCMSSKASVLKSQEPADDDTLQAAQENQ